MRFQWSIEAQDVEKLRAVVERFSTSSVVVDRIERNLSEAKVLPSREAFWHSMVYALVTSVQRSGPRSRSTLFTRQNPFPLSLDACEGCGDLAAMAAQSLTEAGLRFSRKRIPGFLCANLQKLSGDAWTEVEDALRALIADQTVASERRVARFISAPRLEGIGPKQSRNILQYLGLTRFEIPIDSRLVDWFRIFGFPVPMASSALSNHDYYEFVEDGIHRLCREAELPPCVVDGAIFVSADAEPWPENL